jgi:hypothetical protein
VFAEQLRQQLASQPHDADHFQLMVTRSFQPVGAAFMWID